MEVLGEVMGIICGWVAELFGKIMRLLGVVSCFFLGALYVLCLEVAPMMVVMGEAQSGQFCIIVDSLSMAVKRMNVLKIARS